MRSIVVRKEYIEIKGDKVLVRVHPQVQDELNFKGAKIVAQVSDMGAFKKHNGKISSSFIRLQLDHVVRLNTGDSIHHLALMEAYWKCEKTKWQRSHAYIPAYKEGIIAWNRSYASTKHDLELNDDGIGCKYKKPLEVAAKKATVKPTQVTGIPIPVVLPKYVPFFK